MIHSYRRNRRITTALECVWYVWWGWWGWSGGRSEGEVCGSEGASHGVVWGEGVRIVGGNWMESSEDWDETISMK